MGQQTSHREYFMDRIKKIESLFKTLEESKEKRSQFFQDPATLAAQHGLTLSDEEAYGIRSLDSVDLPNLKERLIVPAAAFFDANCGCTHFRQK